jgi:hypothetical protein
VKNLSAEALTAEMCGEIAFALRDESGMYVLFTVWRERERERERESTTGERE